MDSRFGLKDFILLVLVSAVGLLVVLAMYQEDRRWAEARATRLAVQEQGAALADLARRADEQSRAIESLRRSVPEEAFAPEASASTKPAPQTADDAWARAGVAISRPGAWLPVHDPKEEPGYAEGGTLTEILEGTPAKLTPYMHNDVYYDRIVNQAVGEALAMYDSQTLELRGWLAQAWQYDPAGLWLRVRLRDEACFSDGSPVTAQDVRYTFMDYILNPQLNADAFRGQVSAIKDVRVISERVAEFVFVEPAFTNLTAALRYTILPSHVYQRFTPEQINAGTGLLVGSGPYRFQSVDPETQWKPPQSVELVRNDRYWGPRPPVERLRFRFITDAAARLTEFDNGGGDIVRATPEQHQRKSQDPGFTARARAIAWTNMRSGYAFIAWNCAQRAGRPTPFADVRVRQAMALMTDRQRINRDFSEGLGEVISGPFPPGQGDPSITPWPYDLERARALLKEAGWEDRNADGVLERSSGEELTLEFTYPTGSALGEPVGTYLTDQAARLGIRVTMRVTDWAGLRTIQETKDFDALLMAWSWGAPESDPFAAFHSSQASGDGSNWGSWSSPEADALIEQARRTVDAPKRAALWRELHRVIHQEQPYMFLHTMPWIRFVSTRVQNVHPYPVSLDRREFFITPHAP